MTEWKWNGSRWWKFDFHAHTPASSDYGKGPNQASLKKREKEEWLLDHMRAGIDCVAITDHNTAAWIDPLKAALERLKRKKTDGFRQLYLFPGMEISVHGGIHLLAIFDPSKSGSDLEALRGAVGYKGAPGESDGVTHKSFAEVVGAIVERGGIAIPAHADKRNGLFTWKGQTLSQALDCDPIFAMEVVNPALQKPQLYNEKNPRWTELLGSDSHHPSGSPGQRYPGSHFTWVKMGVPNIEGLRLALLDGSLSARRSDQESGDPNDHAPLALESMEISRARFLGRSEKFSLGLNPWLNAVIGGRGTGKSTGVEFLRIALRRGDELPPELESDFEKYGRVYSNREDTGLLTEESSIRVIYRKNGDRFRVQWNDSGDLEPIEQESGGEWRPAEGDIRQRFPVRIYSQKQIFQLAKTPLALLGVVDDAPEVNLRSWSEKWDAEQARFLSLRARAREMETGLADEPRFLGELDDVKRKLAVFEEAGHADVLQLFQKRSRQKRTVEAWEESWNAAGDQLRKIASEIVPDHLDKTDFDPDSAEDSGLLCLAAEALSRLEEIRKALEALSSQANEAISRWLTKKVESSWMRGVNASEKAYEDLREKLAGEGAGAPDAYGELVQRRQAVERRLRELEGRRKQVSELKTQADESLRRLLKIRRERTESRRKFLDHVLGENRHIRIEVAPYGSGETAKEEFRRLIQREGGGFEKDVDSLLGKLHANVDGPEDIEKNLADIKDRVRAIISGRSDSNSLFKDQRFAAHIRKLPPEAMDRLELWFPEDSLHVRYSATGDGRGFRSIQQGSPGQKTAALLAFLLSYGEEPLILDQPEDDLDNRLIYDLIVNRLREVKRHRQVIVVTHNANIVVNGDAELVVALSVKGGETRVESQGGLQEKIVRHAVCAVMEGGRKAFEDRYRRIALEDRHV
ncbi:ABC transporter [Candidatus Desulfarcum epimagneticum]|uniref:ABC transporter n=1 Tax=uncultured Desulfobacteraceae bacterium TaxID=218296 RepID=A0A484HP69_9BACT|nr:ABC transporter [uncultured Desulfobacteraceae bacterium]